MLSEQIDDISRKIIKEKNELTEFGLLGGKTGITLLFAYLSKLYPEKAFLEVTFDYLNDISESLANDELNHSMSGGIAGAGFVFQHLRNIQILDTEEDLNLEQLDEFISKGIDIDYLTNNWDPLHGMVGLGIYFLERNKETGDKKYLEKIVDYLARLRTDVGDYKVWITPGYQKYSNDNYNFGTAHGMPGILSFLAQVYSLGIRKNEIEEMISSCLPFLIKHEIKDAGHCFPLTLEISTDQEEKHKNPRLGWCYGDLCMAFALLHCGNALNNPEWTNKGIEIASKSTKRTIENAGCVDAPFCHGTVGLVHLYHRIYKLTKNEIFKDAAQYWIDNTLNNFYKPGEGAGGYMFHSFNEERNSFEMVPEYSLLEGSAGIALVFLSYAFDIKPEWDIIFLANV